MNPLLHLARRRRGVPFIPHYGKRSQAMIRVLLGSLPRMISDAIAGHMRRDTGIEVVARSRAAADLPMLVEQTHPQVVILSEEDAAEPFNSCATLLDRWPHLKVFVLSPRTRTTSLYWRELAWETGHAVSPDDLVTWIHKAINPVTFRESEATECTLPEWLVPSWD